MNIIMEAICYTKEFHAFTLMFISSGLSAGTFGSDGKKKDKEKKEDAGHCNSAGSTLRWQHPVPACSLRHHK